MKNGKIQWLAVGLTAAFAGCARNHPSPTISTATMTTTTTSTAAGDVGSMSDASGMWIDSVGGTWVDSSGIVRLGGPGGMTVGLRPVDVAQMTNSNIIAHLAIGDTLEVLLSRLGVDRAQNMAVREFAQRMVDAHSAHLHGIIQNAVQNGISPMLAPSDTADIATTRRAIDALTKAPAGPDFDRQLMRAEVAVHEHMLHDLNLMRSQAAGTAQQIVDQTIPVVQQHLSDARNILQQL
ncbi:MAG: hypothetical protein JWM41_1463 [Gemmatimonadetes bacterium]|nr:hypothetical protein [Gemmatimonadota bacterium]